MTHALFLTSAPNVSAPTDAWRVRVEVDGADWAEATPQAKAELAESLRRRYVDTQGNSAMDLVEVWADGQCVSTVELHDPPRRSGPEGTDGNAPKYVRGPLPGQDELRGSKR